jgi:hypothetical protein
MAALEKMMAPRRGEYSADAAAPDLGRRHNTLWRTLSYNAYMLDMPERM